MVFIMRKLAQAVTPAKPSSMLMRRGFASATDSALASLRNQSFLSTAQLS